MVALPAAGTLVADKYRIDALLGQGGMGAVFRARHEVMDKPVALKWLNPALADDAVSRDRFIREARAAARIRHPNVVDVYDVGVHQGALFMVMELLEGESFEDILERGSMPIPLALRLLIGSMHGVAEAHRRNIVHRDIKPENIFVVYDDKHPDGLAKVLDFGVSKLIDDPHNALRITRTGATMGTPLYMSFEQMSGAADIDARTDIYSFGVLLYRALTGKMPFDADSFAGLALAVATQRPPSPKSLRPELPSSIDNVVMKAIAFDRAQRFASMTEMIDALTLLASTEGFLGQMTHPSATPPVLTPKTPVAVDEVGKTLSAAQSTPPVSIPVSPAALPQPPSHRPLVQATAALALLVLIVGGAMLWRQRRAADGGTRTSVAAPVVQESKLPVPPPAAIANEAAAVAPVVAHDEPLPAGALPSITPAAAPVQPPAAAQQNAPQPTSSVPASVSPTASPKKRSPRRDPSVQPLPPVTMEQKDAPAREVTPPEVPRSAAGQRSGTLRRDQL